MKKLSLILVAGCIFFATASLNAQTEYKPFRIDLGLGYAIADGGGGLLVNFEPKYAVIPQLSVGFKFEWDFIVRDISEHAGVGQRIDSYLVTADYHLLTGSFRPFVGTGFGIYQIAAASLAGIGDKNNFGTLLRAGVDVSHFRAVFAYNLPGKDKLKNKTGFYSITVGAYIFGGKK